ncbi:hypothetical protein rosag_06340 [Roseisolibacter agri]|uniref:Uncharacterized protein n=1 Tax=Roseisolibacter agri TaxID=2014610 RepID=A0AA37Q6X0_9BACT|nr:hypothetical protein rosag_06340 [Roseisolibacter agri]
MASAAGFAGSIGPRRASPDPDPEHVTAPVTPPTDPFDALDEAPATLAASSPPAAVRPPPPSPVTVPMGWLLDKAPYAIRARALLELGNVTGKAAEDAQRIAIAHRPAVRLALGQGRDGTWGGRMLTLPRSDDPEFTDVGTVPAVRRLAEYGWPTDSPPLWLARRPLFRLLAQDDDPRFLYELRTELPDPSLAQHGRLRLREAAAATLAQLGFETDPRLRGAATRLLDRMGAFLKAEAPAAGVLPESALPPSMDALLMLAHMPVFRNEHAEDMSRLTAFLMQPAPSGVVKQRVGKTTLPQPRLIMGDPLVDVGDPDGKSMPRVLAWLELFARLGILRRHQPWCVLLDRLLELRDHEGRWTRPVGTPAPDPLTWPTAPLGSPAERGEWSADATFRLALIARLSGRPLELV